MMIKYSSDLELEISCDFMLLLDISIFREVSISI